METTLFNQLTGSNQHVGNFPGVTVEGKSGIVKGHPDVKVVDLPGIYSLSPYTAEEIVTRDFSITPFIICAAIYLILSTVVVIFFKRIT